jgi:LPXTG-motif cell wall-anchored protein
MLRRILVTLAVALAGLLSLGGIASAEPGGYGGEESAPALGVAPEDEVVEPGEPFNLLLGGYTPNEIVDVVGTLNPADEDTPNGLRSARSFARLASPLNFIVTVDGSGAFAIPVQYTQMGTYTFVATGRESGISNSISVVVGRPGGSGNSTGAGNSAGSAGSGSGDSAGSGDYASGTSEGSASGKNLPNTGANLAGPIVIGLSALLAGLALLFFGTRGVVRRKVVRTSTSV